MNSKFKMSAVLFILAASVSACGVQKLEIEKVKKFESAPEVKAPSFIQDSFSMADNPAAEKLSVKSAERIQDGDSSELMLDKTRISIAKSSLEKEFLLQTVMIEQPGAAMGSGMKSRVVALRKRENSIFLMEATQGHTVTRDLPQNLILAEFPILSETENRITFDFNKGMTQLYIYGDWHAVDFEGPWYQPAYNFVSVKTQYSFIESAAFDSQNRLVIRQIAQLALPTGQVNVNTSVEMKYYLSPYRPDPTFKAMESTDLDKERLGYFEVAPQLTLQGTNVTYVSRFHPEKPITYAISANTPEDYKQAVRDGILYWNKLTGKEMIRVVDAPAGAVAPDSDFNIIQWVNFDTAGFAYADAQMDPRTGQILHAQVYFTSSFVSHSKNYARNLIRKLSDQTPADKQAEKFRHAQLSLTGFIQPKMCNYQEEKEFNEGLARLAAAGADDATLMKVSQDYIREVVAHEVGHTLGLRHNFAGSVYANFTVDQREGIVKNYLKTGKTPAGITPTSSVMEYQMVEEGALTGSNLVNQADLLQYDRKAIGTLYLGEKYADSQIPLFCTDSHQGKYLDCLVFDTGSSPAAYFFWKQKSNMANLPVMLFDDYVALTKAPESAGIPTIPVIKVPLPSTSDIAGYLSKAQMFAIVGITDFVQLIQIQRNYPVVDDANSKIVHKAEIAAYAQNIQSLGGLTTLLAGVPADYGDKAIAQFDSLVERYASGTGSNGVAYSFTAEEILIMKQRIREIFAPLPAELAKADIASLAALPYDAFQLIDQPLADEFLSILKARVQKYVFSTTGITLRADLELKSATEVKKVQAQLPLFTYPAAVRIAAASLISSQKTDQIPDFGLVAKAEFSKQYTDLMQASIGAPIEQVQKQKLAREPLRWILEAIKVQGSF